MNRALKSLLRISLVLLALFAIGVLALRMSKGSTKRPVDSWVVPSMRTAPPVGTNFQMVHGVVWVGPREKAEAEQRLRNDIAVPLDDAEVKRFAGSATVTGEDGCTPYLVRGMGARNRTDDLARVTMDADTIDVLVYGGFRCHLYEAARSPFVACLNTPPKQILTSFRCESPSPIGWLLHGSGDRW